MAVNWSSITPVRPTGTEGTVAAAHVPMIANPSRADLQQIAATYANATLVDADHVRFDDDSWMAFNPNRNNALERGVGSVVFMGRPNPIGPNPLQVDPRSAAGQAAANPPIDLAQYTVAPPGAAHGFTVAAALPHVQSPDAASLRAAVNSMGQNYTEVARDMFLFDDQSFVAFSPQGRIERGVDRPGERIIFRGKPLHPTQLPMAQMAQFPHSPFADLVDSNPTSAQPLLDAGFTQVQSNYFTGPNGQWAFHDGSSFLFGINNQQVNRSSFQRPLPAADPTLQIDRSQPFGPQGPSSMSQMSSTGRPALADIGIVSIGTPHDVYVNAGFGHNGQGQWIHPDGSWVDVSGGFAPVVGWKGYSLDVLPYRGGWY